MGAEGWIWVSGVRSDVDASEEIERGWINCVLAIASGDKCHGFSVEARSAIDILAAESPGAAAWFYQNRAELFFSAERTFLHFDPGCCQVVNTPFAFMPRRFSCGIGTTFGQFFDRMYTGCNDRSICRTYLDIARERTEQIHPDVWPALRQYPLTRVMVLRLLEVVAVPVRWELNYYINASSGRDPFNKLYGDCLEYFKLLYIEAVKAGLEYHREDVIVPIGPAPIVDDLIRDDWLAIGPDGLLRPTEKGEREAAALQMPSSLDID